MGGGADVETGAAEYDAEAIDDDKALLPPAEDEDPDDIVRDLDSNTSSSMKQQSADAIVEVVTHCIIRTAQERVTHRLSEYNRQTAVYGAPRSGAARREGEREQSFSQMSEVLASAAEISAEMKTLRAVVTCDGETFQLRAIDKVVNGAEAAKLESLEFMKFPAACSFIFQPCDFQPGFRTLKRKAAGADDDDASMYSVPTWMEDGFVQKILAALDPSSRRTYAEFLSRLPTYLHAAFIPSTVRSGWRDPGFIPYTPVLMLQRWPGFARLTTAQGQRVMDCIPSLALKAAKGYLSPQEILAEISPFLPVTMYTSADEVDLMSLSLNRWLATWVNKEGTVAPGGSARGGREGAWTAAEDAEAQRREAGGGE
ncbi:hypothetical protein B484DRAFT_481893 [Ochromonadaceae sp. CCMP2298]|nr:hypothetical protein B484DRAFT_481893 [Ochromonadaceae sp. CCMP2298]